MDTRNTALRREDRRMIEEGVNDWLEATEWESIWQYLASLNLE